MNKALSMLAAAAAVMSCQWDPADHDVAPVEEKLTLSASSENVVLLEENLKKDAVTFSWTEARDMGEDYMISYETKLDVLGNNFGSKTVIRTDMDPGRVQPELYRGTAQHMGYGKMGTACKQAVYTRISRSCTVGRRFYFRNA